MDRFIASDFMGDTFGLWEWLRTVETPIEAVHTHLKFAVRRSLAIRFPVPSATIRWRQPTSLIDDIFQGAKRRVSQCAKGIFFTRVATCGVISAAFRLDDSSLQQCGALSELF